MKSVCLHNRNMELIVYSAWWCPTAASPSSFSAKYIPYTEIDIDKTPGAAQEVIRQTGSGLFHSLSSMAAGCSPTVPERAFYMRKCPNCWESSTLKARRSSLLRL